MPRIPRPGSRPLSAAIALSSLGLLMGALMPLAAADTTNKAAYVDVSPAAAAPGSTVDFEFTIRNGASSQQLGSANVTAPPGFGVVSASVLSGSSGTSSVSSNTVQLRNLGLAFNATVVVEVVAVTPCSGGGDWAFVVKQSNDFNGPPGNDFVVVPDPNVTTTINGSCQLAFLRQPANAKVGTVITSDAYGSLFSPPSTDFVQVAVEDGNGNVLTSASATITLQIGNNPSAGSLSGSLSQSTSDGVAVFDDISINKAGIAYTLTACDTSCASPGSLGTVTSGPFNADQFAFVCGASATCTSPTVTSSTSDKTKLQVTGQGASQNDVVTVSFNVVGELDCDGYVEPDDATATFDFNGDGSKIATLTIFKSVVNAVPNNGVSFFQVCYASTSSFTTKAGYNLTTDTDPEGNTLYIGVLPDCTSKNPAVAQMPCVTSKTKDRAGNALLTFAAPPGDPHSR